MNALVAARDLTRIYRTKTGPFSKPQDLRAVGGVSFEIEAGKTLAIVGESGCGKSTLARLVTLIEKPDDGTLRIAGSDALTNAGALRQTVQLVFQNPYGSLNPRRKIGKILEEPLIINTNLDKSERRRNVADMMRRVGLSEDQAQRYPHMFSGGQRQRIAIARALMLRPKLVVADEPVSALDVSVQAQVLALLAEIRSRLELAMLFITHDLRVAAQVCDHVAVMQAGRVVEYGPAREVFLAPRHEYTRALFAAAPGRGFAFGG
jgi:dipeptide transport system ATP-binding protein